MQLEVSLEFVRDIHPIRKHCMNEVIGLGILEKQFLPGWKVSSRAADKRVLVAGRQIVNMDKVGQGYERIILLTGGNRSLRVIRLRTA
jgi:hypothetical protein